METFALTVRAGRGCGIARRHAADRFSHCASAAGDSQPLRAASVEAVPSAARHSASPWHRREAEAPRRVRLARARIHSDAESGYETACRFGRFACCDDTGMIDGHVVLAIDETCCLGIERVDHRSSSTRFRATVQVAVGRARAPGISLSRQAVSGLTPATAGGVAAVRWRCMLAARRDLRAGEIKYHASVSAMECVRVERTVSHAPASRHEAAHRTSAAAMIRDVASASEPLNQCTTAPSSGRRAGALDRAASRIAAP